MLRSKGVTWGAAEGSGAGAAQAEDDDDPNDTSEDAVERRKEKLRVTLGEQPPQNCFIPVSFPFFQQLQHHTFHFAHGANVAGVIYTTVIRDVQTPGLPTINQQHRP